ncbi:hypothetical protein ALC53_12327 [Atta colombica]|uniref:Uncharacterized protein n=1 Tax=Atta colombica TaxID=520822 RepID=A0A195AYS1_9HYME|nr:hypothetical protein ALC53_12327 [Atta colombica]
MSLTPAYEQHTKAWKCERATAARLRFASSDARAQFTTPRAAEETRATRRRPGASKRERERERERERLGERVQRSRQKDREKGERERERKERTEN